jgi:hypothetical protein
MRQDHQKFFKEVCEFYDLLLHRCEPYARAYQSLSLSTRPSDKPLYCRYDESYYPQAGYGVRVKDAIGVFAMDIPSNTSIASATTFLGFDENKSEHQDMITEAVKKLKLKLKERGRTPFYYEKLVAFTSSETALTDPTVYQQAGTDFIEKQMELVPLYRETINNLMGLDFNKNYYYEFDIGKVTDTHNIYGRFLFFVEESNNRRFLNVTTWKGFHMKEEEFENLEHIIKNHRFSDISVNDHTKEYPHNRLPNMSIDKLRELSKL